MKKLKKSFALVALLLCTAFIALPVSAVEGENSSQGGAAVSSTPEEPTIPSSSIAPGEPTSSLQSSSAEHASQISSTSVSSLNNQTTVSRVESSKKSTTGNTASQSAVSQKSNVGGTISDSIDTSGWGSNAAETSSQAQSVGMASNAATSKKMFNLAKLIWMIIWIPIALIVASVAALVHVNKKSFLNEAEGAPGKSGHNSSRGGRKAGGSNGTHTYKAAGRRSAPRKKAPKKNIYRPHD